MSLDDYRTMFIGIVLVSILISVSPVISFYLRSERERFSELWVLGPNGMAENYPFNVRTGSSYRMFVGVGCHMGSSTYYTVYVKFRNQTQQFPNASTYSSLLPRYEFQVFLRDGTSCPPLPLNFTVVDAYNEGNSTFVRHLAINDMVSEVNCTAAWDPEYKGFYYQIFFELWIYDFATENLKYHNRFVGIWLNVTLQS